MTRELTLGMYEEGSPNNTPVFVWDVQQGVTVGYTRCSESSEAVKPTEVSTRGWAEILNEVKKLPESPRRAMLTTLHGQMGKGELANFLDLMLLSPRGSVIIIQHSNQLLNFLRSHQTQQATMNLRDAFAASNRTLIFMGNDVLMPDCLRNDTIVLEDALPDREEIAQYIHRIAEGAEVSLGDDIEPIIDAVSGLPKFQAEQALALSITRNGYDENTLWREKKKLVDLTRGLSVHYEGGGFGTVGGLSGIKEYFTRLFNGPKAPQLIVWIDEIEKSGIAHTNDTNGINADALGLMLSHIEDHNSYCVSLTGLPGTGKSLIAKTVGPEFGRMVIRLDLGAMKGSFVGESESNLRAALRLISALSDDNALFIATSNSVNGLDTALRSRFVDTFYFPLPSSEELAPVWDVHKAKYSLFGENPDDTNWVPRNVKQCCEKAYRLGMDLDDAALTIIPTGVAMAKEVNKLNEQAHGRFLSASTGEKFEFMGAFSED